MRFLAMSEIVSGSRNDFSVVSEFCRVREIISGVSEIVSTTEMKSMSCRDFDRNSNISGGLVSLPDIPDIVGISENVGNVGQNLKNVGNFVRINEGNYKSPANFVAFTLFFPTQFPTFHPTFHPTFPTFHPTFP